MRWIGRTTGGSSIKVPLDAPSNVVATEGNAQVSLTWNDPPDKYATNEGGSAAGDAVLVSQWAYTRVIRKQGSAPVSVNDGTMVCESGVRNQYASTPFVDSLVENNTLYYYGLYAFTTTGVVSEGAVASVTPIAGTALSQLAEGTAIQILENGAPVQYYLAKHNYEPSLNGQGRELIARSATVAERQYSGSSIAFDSSALAEYLNSSFIKRYSEKVKSWIGTTTYQTRSDGYRLKPGGGTSAIFIPSAFEAGFPDDEVADGTELATAALVFNANLIRAGSIWTRTLAGYEMVRSLYTSPDGHVLDALDYPSKQNRVLCFLTLPSGCRVDADLTLMENVDPE